MFFSASAAESGLEKSKWPHLEAYSISETLAA